MRVQGLVFFAMILNVEYLNKTDTLVDIFAPVGRSPVTIRLNLNKKQTNESNLIFRNK